MARPYADDDDEEEVAADDERIAYILRYDGRIERNSYTKLMIACR